MCTGPCETSGGNARADGRIEYTKWLEEEDLVRAYARADIFVHPARWPEPFGRTIVEAMHAGVPVIVPRESGSRWVAGEGGMTFENGDPDSLLAAMSALVRDPSRRRMMGEKGRARAWEFSKDVVLPQLLHALDVV